MKPKVTVIPATKAYTIPRGENAPIYAATYVHAPRETYYRDMNDLRFFVYDHKKMVFVDYYGDMTDNEMSVPLSGFNSMMPDIKFRNAIITTSRDTLTQTPEQAATIQRLLDEGIIRVIYLDEQ